MSKLLPRLGGSCERAAGEEILGLRVSGSPRLDRGGLAQPAGNDGRWPMVAPGGGVGRYAAL
eukprot:7260689-Prymnesium_polylepis.1